MWNADEGLSALITCARCHSYFTTTGAGSAEPGAVALAVFGFPSIFHPAFLPCLSSIFPRNKTLLNAVQRCFNFPGALLFVLL